MSSYGAAQGLASAVGTVYQQQATKERQQAQLDAEGQMQKARLEEENNLAHFQVMSADKRAELDRQHQTDLTQLQLDAQQRQWHAQLANEKSQFQTMTGMKVSDEELGRVDQAYQNWQGAVAAHDKDLSSNLLMQQNVANLNKLQDALANAPNAQAKAQIQQMINNNPEYMTQQNLDLMHKGIFGIATDMPTRALVYMTYGGMGTTEAVLHAQHDFGDTQTKGPQLPSATTPPTSMPIAPKQPFVPSVTPSPIGQSSAPPPPGGNNLINPGDNSLDALRRNVLGPGTIATANSPSVGSGGGGQTITGPNRPTPATGSATPSWIPPQPSNNLMPIPG